MTKRSWKRRDFLRAAGVTASAGAVARFLPTSAAAAAEEGPNIVFVSHGSGTDIPSWRCQGSETDFSLSYCLEPLAPYQADLLVLDGIDNEAAYRRGARGSAHNGMSTLWTGIPLPAGPLTALNCDWPRAPSVDRIIADRVGDSSPFDVYHWGTWPASLDGPNQGPNGMNYFSAPSAPVSPQLRPDLAFDELFGGLEPGDPAEAQRRARDESILDNIRGELGRVRGELPSEDRETLDAHLSAVRSMEMRLGTFERAVCTAPERPRDFTVRESKDHDLHGVITELQFEMMGFALACGLTRVAAFQWEHTHMNTRYLEDYGYESFGMMHAMTHQMSYRQFDEAENGIARQHLADVTRWRSDMIAGPLLSTMQPVVRDNTILVWAMDISEGGSHSNRNIPVTIFQGKDVGYFNTGTNGRFLKYGNFDPIPPDFRDARQEHGGEPFNKVLVSLCHAMGLDDVDSVGDDAISTGPLEELV